MDDVMIAGNNKYIIPNLPWKYFDESIKQIAYGELSKVTSCSDEMKFLEAIDFIKTIEKEETVYSGGGFLPKVETKEKVINLQLTTLGKTYYTYKQIKNNEIDARKILSEALKKHPAVILISQTLSGSKNIKRINIYNLLKHHNFDLDFQKNVVLNNFLEILKLGEIISYNKNTRDVKVLWQQETNDLPSHQFISPETPFSNIKRLREIIISLKGAVYWIDKHFDKKAFEILANSLDASKINNFIIISGDQNKTQSAVTEFLRLKAELHNKGINLEWKIITDQNTLSGFHDRWLCDSNTAWNIPPVNSIFKGQESEMLKTSNKPNISKLLKHSSLVN